MDLLLTATAPTSVTVLFAILLGALILCLAMEEKLHAKKSVIAGVFAVICLLLGTFFQVLPFEPVVVGSAPFVAHDAFDGTLVDEDGSKHVVHVPELTEAIPAQAAEEASGGDDAEHPDAHSASVGRESGQHEDKIEPGGVEAEEHPISDGGHRIGMPVYIPAVDWGVITVILGSALFVDITSKSGLFTWIALKVTKFSKGDPLKLLVLYGIMTVTFSAVLNNVTAMIIVGSLTAVSLKKLGRNHQLLGFLLVEGLLTNIGGLLTLISSVPNIIIGTAADISFVEFFYKSAPYVVVATFITLMMATRVYKIRRLRGDVEIAEAEQLVAGFDETDGIESWGFLWFAAAMLVLFIVTIAMSSVTPVISDLQMGFVAMAFAVVMLLRFKSDVQQFYQAIDWDLIAFFVALFVVINTMEHAGVLDAIGEMLAPVLAWPEQRASSAIVAAAAVFSSVTDNIPLAAMLAKILIGVGTPINTATTDASTIWWAVIFGANLGGNLTPIGSASTLVSVTLIHRYGLKLSFLDFVKHALPFAIVQILMAVLYVVFVL